MAYWWVSQNKTFGEESAGHYLRAPLRDKAGQTPHHWATMTEVRPGDVIFCYVEQTVAAIAVAQTAAVPSPRPFTSKEGEAWERDGRRIEAQYEILNPPYPIPPVAGRLLALLPEKYSPLTREGTGNPLPGRCARLRTQAPSGAGSGMNTNRGHVQGHVHGPPRCLGAPTPAVVTHQGDVTACSVELPVRDQGGEQSSYSRSLGRQRPEHGSHAVGIMLLFPNMMSHNQGVLRFSGGSGHGRACR